MGRREKEKLQRLKEQTNQPQRSAADVGRGVENKVLELRAEISAKNQQYIETLVRMTKEISQLRSDVNVLMRALQKVGTINQALIDQVIDEMKADQSRMIDPKTGKMSGSPVITQYNCDFTLSHPGYKIVEVKNL